MEADAGFAEAKEGEQGQQQREAEVPACAVAGEDDVGGWNWLVQGARGWGDKRQIGD